MHIYIYIHISLLRFRYLRLTIGDATRARRAIDHETASRSI